MDLLPHPESFLCTAWKSDRNQRGFGNPPPSLTPDQTPKGGGGGVCCTLITFIYILWSYFSCKTQKSRGSRRKTWTGFHFTLLHGLWKERKRWRFEVKWIKTKMGKSLGYKKPFRRWVDEKRRWQRMIDLSALIDLQEFRQKYNAHIDTHAGICIKIIFSTTFWEAADRSKLVRKVVSHARSHNAKNLFILLPTFQQQSPSGYQITCKTVG